MQFDMNFQSVAFISNILLVRIPYRMKLKLEKKINTINFFLIIDRYSSGKNIEAIKNVYDM